MCEYSGRLIAWLDRELPEEEATNVGRHVGQCAECRKAVSEYEDVSRAFLACYEASGDVVEPNRKVLLWTLSGVAAAAAMVAVVLLAQPPVEKLSFHPPSPAPAPMMTVRAPAHVRHRTVAASVHRRWFADEPVVEVALPADALFPPGAVPPGFNYIADVHFQQ